MHDCSISNVVMIRMAYYGALLALVARLDNERRSAVLRISNFSKCFNLEDS